MKGGRSSLELPLVRASGKSSRYIEVERRELLAARPMTLSG